MATYAIGDIHGCFNELQALLLQVEFSKEQDQLWFVGDLVNRGPNSLEVLRFIKSLPNAVVVLGNHDFHLLETAYRDSAKRESFQDVLSAPDAEELLHWLRMQPLMHYDATLGYAMVHAGIFPGWSLEEAQACAREAEATLRGEHYRDMLRHLYGNQPAQWSPSLSGWNRLRFIVNAFTRMRFCHASGELDFSLTMPPGGQPEGYLPWYAMPDRKTQGIKVIFGHWAAHRDISSTVMTKESDEGIFCLDTGCVWGGRLTAMRLEDGQRFGVQSSK